MLCEPVFKPSCIAARTLKRAEDVFGITAFWQLYQLIGRTPEPIGPTAEANQDSLRHGAPDGGDEEADEEGDRQGQEGRNPCPFLTASFFIDRPDRSAARVVQQREHHEADGGEQGPLVVHNEQVF